MGLSAKKFTRTGTLEKPRPAVRRLDWQRGSWVRRLVRGGILAALTWRHVSCGIA